MNNGFSKAAGWSKYGFTTGMAAAAAAAAAAEFYLTGKEIDRLKIETPDNRLRLLIPIAAVGMVGAGFRAKAIKCAGPDRDITDGIEIEAHLQLRLDGEVRILAGEGVGLATKPGLAVAVGAPAVNPVPYRHIVRAVKKRLAGGADVTISAIGGRELANKTFNPRLGIEGGISILGTSGLVRPMSVMAWRAALTPQLDQSVAFGHRVVAMAPGNLGAGAAAALCWPETAIVQMGNFAGYMVAEAAKRQLNILIIGHLGKIVKLAWGYKNTHHGNTPDRLELLTKLAARHSTRAAAQVAKAASAEAAINALVSDFPEVLDQTAELARKFVGSLAAQRKTAVAVTNLRGQVVAASGDFPYRFEEGLFAGD